MFNQYKLFSVILDIIRTLKKGDSEGIRKLVEKCEPFVVAHNLYVYWILENYYPHTSFVSGEEKKIIGFLGAMPATDKGCIFLWQICVHPDYRRGGIAYKLIKALLDVQKEFKIKHIQFSITDENEASKRMFGAYAERNNLKMVELRKEKIGQRTDILYQYE